MLKTLLEIGRTLRNQPGAEGIRRHRYIRPAPAPGKGQRISRYEIPVSEEMTFDLRDRAPLDNEREYESLFFLNYKTSSADTMKKYVFGDICRYMTQKPSEARPAEAEVNFVLGTPSSKEGSKYQVNSFERGKPDAADLNTKSIRAFRDCLERQMPDLLELFETDKSIYLNFRFGPRRLHWYELEHELAAINGKLLNEFVRSEPSRGYTLTKFLHKTLAADKGLMPQFREESAHKSWLFPTLDDVSDLLYAVDFSQLAMIHKGDIKIVVLPRSEEAGKSRLTAQDIEQFFDARGIRQAAEQEETVSAATPAESGFGAPEEENEEDELSRPLIRARDIEAITQFDFVFSKASSSPSSPDIDIIELAGVSRSRVGELHRQIQAITHVLHEERRARFALRGVQLKKPPAPLTVLGSFNNVLGDIGRDKKKFSSHLLKVLPQVYCGSYVEDDLLLPSFIAVTERDLRSGKSGYDFLRFDLLFLWRLQDENRKDGSRVERIQATDSYLAGQKLGMLARPLRLKINSFEKNYVGLLSRRVAQVQDLVSFQNFIDEKLILHDVAYPALKEASRELAALVDGLARSYNREYCVFGFFGAYFKPFPRKADGTAEGASDMLTESESEEEEQP